MFSFSSPILPESSHSNALLLCLAAPPQNLSLEYFTNLLAQYGLVTNVKILSKSLLDCRVLVEMSTLEAAKTAKKALDQLSSTFIKCSYSFEELPMHSNSIGSYETLEDTTAIKGRHCTSLNEIVIQDQDVEHKSMGNIHSSQKQIPSYKSINLSKTICLSGIKDIDALKLYNIFSNFGNVDKILVINLKSFALIKYMKEDYAVFAMQNCQNLNFFQCTLNISYAGDDAIDRLVGLDTLYQEQDYFIGQEDTDRFNQLNKMILFPPSQVLHISNLKKVSSNAETMWDIFSDYGIVEVLNTSNQAVKVLNSQFKFMCLVKMESIKAALEAMALMHNEEVDGRNIQISFTKARI